AASAFRRLVVNDLVDQLAPVIYEMIRTGLVDQLAAYYPASSEPGRTSLEYTTNTIKIEHECIAKFHDKININLPSTRNPKDRYPISQRDMVRFFLPRNLYWIAKDVQAATIAGDPRGNDIRNYLRENLWKAYVAMTRLNARALTSDPALPPPG